MLPRFLDRASAYTLQEDPLTYLEVCLPFALFSVSDTYCNKARDPDYSIKQATLRTWGG